VFVALISLVLVNAVIMFEMFNTASAIPGNCVLHSKHANCIP